MINFHQPHIRPIAGLGLFSGGDQAFTVRGLPTACSTACVGDFNRSHTVELREVFAFLAAWFAGC